MNFVKKLLAVLLAVTLSVSCFVLFSSAEAPELSVVDLERMFENRVYFYKDGVYASRTFDDENLGTYAANTFGTYDKYNYKNDYYMTGSSSNYVYGSNIVDDNGNKVLELKNVTGMSSLKDNDRSDMSAMVISSGTAAFTTNLVVAFDVKVVDEDGDGCYITINFDSSETKDRRDYLTIDFRSARGPAIKYTKYDDEQERVTTCNMEGLTPELDKWYTVTAVFNCDDNNVNIEVSERDNPENKVSSGTVKFKAAGNFGINYAKVVIRGISAKTCVYVDDFGMYKGPVVRDVCNPGNEINSVIMLADEIANSESASIEQKLAVSEFYQKIFFDKEFGMEYTPAADSENYEEITEIIEGAKGFINQAHAVAFMTQTEKFENNQVSGYYDLIELYENASEYGDFFADADTEEKLLLLDGIDENGENGNVKASDILAAKNVCNNLIPAKIERIRQQTEAVVNLVGAFDYDNHNYGEIKNFIASIEDFTDCDGTFKYREELELTENDANYKYEYAAQAIEEYAEIKLMLAEIDANAISFMSAIIAIPENPQKTVGFGAIYANYLKASAVFVNGTVHESLDVKTYPAVAGVSLEECIGRYSVIEAYILGRMAESNEFISLIGDASYSATYTKTLERLDAAAVYLDADIENKSVEVEYSGVAEAIATYNLLREKLAGNVADAEAYKAAVNAINIDAAYKDLKAAVTAALTLQEAGAVDGIAGITEANKKLSEAAAKVGALEGNSATLIAATKALKSAETLAERRELIFIGTNAALGAEDSISGVTAARAELEAAIAQFNADVEAANAGFFASVKNASDITSYAAPSDNVFKMADIIKKLFN